MINYRDAEKIALSKKTSFHVAVRIDRTEDGWFFLFSTTDYLDTGDIFSVEMGGHNIFVSIDGRSFLIPSNIGLQDAMYIAKQGNYEEFTAIES